MRTMVRGFMVWTLGLAVLVGLPAVSFARPKKPLNLCACTCQGQRYDSSGKYIGPWSGYGSVLTAGACSEFSGRSESCVDKAGNKFKGNLSGCQHKGTVATGLTPGTGGVLQPAENAPPGGVKPPAGTLQKSP